MTHQKSSKHPQVLLFKEEMQTGKGGIRFAIETQIEGFMCRHLDSKLGP